MTTTSYRKHDLIIPELLSIKYQEVLPNETNDVYTSKLTKALILQFDSLGNSEMKQMSRADVLNLALEAAKEAEERMNSVDLLENTGLYCDVQNVHMRDLRKLDVAFTITNEPSIMIRKQAILINADPIRSVILRNTCLVFVPDGADSLLSLLMMQFKEHGHESHVPFEFRAIEALLSVLCRTLAQEYDRINPVINEALERLSNIQMSSGELETLRTLKNTVSEFDSQVIGIRRALMEILDNEEDLRLLHLTKLFKDPSLIKNLDSFDPEDAEVMLEVYLQEIHSTRSKVSLLQHKIQNTESLVMLKLDSVRNYLLTADVIFSLVSMCMTFGMFITGAFGMNLRSGIEEDRGYFWSVMLGLTAVTIMTSIIGIYYFKQRGVILG